MLERCKGPLRRFAVYRGLRFAWHFATDDVFRHDHIRRLRGPKGQFQYRSLTFPDRYPAVFRFVREELASVREPRLLSFGCATGEEVFTLRTYFPDALIKGIDINAHNIARCGRALARQPDGRLDFACASSAERERPESYDAAFCMAVFQHSALKKTALESCAALIRFADFEQAVTGIARALKPGGLLAIRHADFRFGDTECSRGFRAALRIAPNGELRPRFDRNNRRLPDESETEAVWRKLAAG